VSDHIRGRGLGRPRGHFGWSLTPRYYSWRPLRRRFHHAGGIGRRPRTTGCNLHDGRKLLDALTACEPRSLDQDGTSMRANSRGTPRAEWVFPPVFPLDTLILAATMVGVVLVEDDGPLEGEWQLWRSIRCRSKGRGSRGLSSIAT
jgi:hypothetical protein